MNDAAQQEIRDHLEMMVEMAGSRAPKEWSYKCAYDFVLRHGRAFEYASCPANVESGAAKECYGNAFNLCMDSPNLTYVEGYATCIIPVDHAWCVAGDGTVVDPTWDQFKHDKEPAYFGVPFHLEYVRRVILEAEVYGVIWKGGTINVPLMTCVVPESEWLVSHKWPDAHERR